MYTICDAFTQRRVNLGKQLCLPLPDVCRRCIPQVTYDVVNEVILIMFAQAFPLQKKQHENILETPQ